MLFDWSRKLAPPSQPIRCKLKPIAPWSLAFSRATGRLHAFTSSCHWLPLIISFTLIGRCDYFGFGFRHSIEKRSILLAAKLVEYIHYRSKDRTLRYNATAKPSLLLPVDRVPHRSECYLLYNEFWMGFNDSSKLAFLGSQLVGIRRENFSKLESEKKSPRPSLSFARFSFVSPYLPK